MFTELQGEKGGFAKKLIVLGIIGALVEKSARAYGVSKIDATKNWGFTLLLSAQKDCSCAPSICISSVDMGH